MLKIWMLVPADKSMCVSLESFENDDEKITSYLEGRSHNWEPVKVVTRRKGNKSDYIHYLIGVPILSAKAVEVLTPLIGEYVNFLPLFHDEHELYIMKVNPVQDFIDMTNPVERKTGYGFFAEYVHIIPEKIEKKIPIFRLPQHLNTRIYVTDDFKDLVEQKKLKTFQFVKVWDTEYDEEQRKERLRSYDQYYFALSSRQSVSYTQAVDMLSIGKLARDRNSMMRNGQTGLLLGEIFDDESVRWIGPIYIPPMFFERQWYVYESDESERAVQEYFAELSHEVNGPKGNVITFKDKNLEGIVRRELQVYKGDLTDVHLLKLRHIIPNYKDGIIFSLSGIEHAKNMLELAITDNEHFDISELSFLPKSIQGFRVSNCALKSITFNTSLELPYLRSINLEDNNIDDLSALKTFPLLTYIDVQNNNVADILPLNQFTNLESLIINNNPVRNIHNLSLPKLKTLFIEGILVEDWEFLLINFPALTYVSISEVGMTETSKKNLKQVIKHKRFKVKWTYPDGTGKLYNDLVWK